MLEDNINEYLESSLDGLKKFTDAETFIGKPINTPSGVTVIPISKITMGFASGGLDLSARKLASQKGSGSGGGTGLSITPLAFLTVGPSAEIKLVPLADSATGVERIASLIERAPDLIGRIKDSLT